MEMEIARIYQFAYNSLMDPSKSQDEFGRTPLHYVHPNTVQTLHDILSLQIYDVNHQDCLHHTALYRALLTPTPEIQQLQQLQQIVYLLLLHKADPNLHHPSDPSPLMLAVLKQDDILVDMLLAAGADPNVRMPVSGVLMREGDTAASLATRLHTMLPVEISVQQLCILGKLILHDTISPNVVFHALQQTKDPHIRRHILKMNSLNPAPPTFI